VTEDGGGGGGIGSVASSGAMAASFVFMASELKKWLCFIVKDMFKMSKTRREKDGGGGEILIYGLDYGAIISEEGFSFISNWSFGSRRA
jgi:hypothetical protein